MSQPKREILGKTEDGRERTEERNSSPQSSVLIPPPFRIPSARQLRAEYERLRLSKLEADMRKCSADVAEVKAARKHGRRQNHEHSHSACACPACPICSTAMVPIGRTEEGGRKAEEELNSPPSSVFRPPSSEGDVRKFVCPRCGAKTTMFLGKSVADPDRP